MKRLLALFTVVAVLAGCDDAAGPGARGVVAVLTRNLYIGADVDPIVQSQTLNGVLTRVAEAYATVQATNFPERAKALADEIAAAQPHLVGLQEVFIIRVQSPGDYLTGNAVQATTVVYDYLDLLLDELALRGLDYDVVATTQGTDIELPSATGDDIRVTDREVILARGDVVIADAGGNVFTTRLTVPIGQTGVSVTILRGWAGVDATVDGLTYRFVSTHLEPGVELIQRLQGAELVQSLSGETVPIILLGDFNSAADGSTTATYGDLVAAGFDDAWSLAHPGDPGYTCCHVEDLSNVTPMLDERIDVIFTRDGVIGTAGVEVVGDETADRVSGLWPSDHAGVVATLEFQR